jgi:sjoegren syndrome nuclear autoantigen 1
LQQQIAEEEDEKRKIQNDIRLLTDRLAKVNESLSRKISARSEFDRTIAETEAAYTKVV